MKNLYLLSTSILVTICFLWITGCNNNYLEIDTIKLQEKLYNPRAIKYEPLLSSTVLYLDHSTCVILAVQSSPVFKALRPNLGQYCDTLRLIKGGEFESIPLDRQDNRVSEALERINQDISFADIRKVIWQICHDNQQAILISDCESYKDSRFLDIEPYMSEPFRNWMEKGHSIYIITEPYQESYRGIVYEKKRFYFIFTDDRLEAPINYNLLGEIQPLIQDSTCTLFKMTNSDLNADPPENNMIAEDLSYDVKHNNDFDMVTIDDSWDDIREYVMKLDEYGEQLVEEKPIPLIQNIVFNDGENFIINDIKIEATNITAEYLALEDKSIQAKMINISEGFAIDNIALQKNKLNVMITSKIFTDGFLSNEYGGNLLRLDFVINDADLKPYNPALFEWRSIWLKETAICVSKSIRNALLDAMVFPTCPKRRIIHTIFINTQSYN